MYFVIAAHFFNMIRDTYQPFGFSNVPPAMWNNWLVSSAMMTPVLFATIQYPMGECNRCHVVAETLPKTPMFQWCELIYVVVLPIVAISFFREKYGEHPDYENAAITGKNMKEFRTQAASYKTGW